MLCYKPSYSVENAAGLRNPAGLCLLEMIRECGALRRQYQFGSFQLDYGVLGRQYWFPSVQVELVSWKCSGNVVCWEGSIGSLQSSWTWSAGNAQGIWCVPHVVMISFSLAGLGLLEMLRECGVLGR